jgi:hypothetical protein
VVGLAPGQGLSVRVDGDELDSLQPGFEHAVDGVGAGTADAYDAYHRGKGPGGLYEGAPGRVGVLADVPGRLGRLRLVGCRRFGSLVVRRRAFFGTPEQEAEPAVLHARSFFH